MQTYFDIISGSNHEWYATLSRMALRLCSAPYAMISELRNIGYDYGAIRVRGVGMPVISIGNLTTGGTGKTPVVAWMSNWLAEQGFRPAIVSRGYRSLDGEANDEKRLLDDLCPGVPHVQHPRRLLAAEQVISANGANVIVLDDGFQHRQLHRDLDVVLVDAMQPWGYDALLPRGLLRERCGQLRRADLVLMTRCELAADADIERIRQRISRMTSAPILRTAFLPRHLINSSGQRRKLTFVGDQRAFGFCGIGNPGAFFETLCEFVPQMSQETFLGFPDHYHYQPEDLRVLARRARAVSTELLLTTRKDLVKIRQDEIESLPLWALEIGLVFLDDAALLTGLLRTTLGETTPSEPVAVAATS